MEDKATYKNNKFGIFHVKAVKTSKEAVLAMLPQGKEYHVYDTTMTKEVKKGEGALAKADVSARRWLFRPFRPIHHGESPIYIT